MVGILQHARAGTGRGCSYLLCRPVGQEATRTAAMYRVLSDRLTREGCEALTFDYHGTGDSPGEEADQSLAAWTDDVLAAHELLCADGNTSVHWFAMGLGATLAARAAARSTRPPSHIVLWEPVLDGPAYLDALMTAHRTELTREFRYPWYELLRQGRVEEPAAPGDVLGFSIGETLARELRALPGLPLAPALRRGIRMVCGIHPEQRVHFGDILDGSNGLLKLQYVETRANWMSSQAMGTATVPADVPRTLLSTFA